MTDTKQPEALRLARELEGVYPVNIQDQGAAAAELRRLHAENEQLRLHAKGADELTEVWKGRAQDFMNGHARLLNANHSLWERLDRMRAGLGQPQQREPLTDKQIWRIVQAAQVGERGKGHTIARAVERAHGIGLEAAPQRPKDEPAPGEVRR